MTTYAPAPPTTLDPEGPRAGWRRFFSPGWPLVALYAGFPLWWVLGLSHFIFLILAVPMALELLRRRRVRTPPRFGLWLMFLAWMAAGVFLLWVQAPGTVAEGGLLKVVPFAYRAAWYFAITVVCLYVMNLSRRELPGRKVAALLGFLFVVVTFGGLAGVLFPQVTFPSALELVLPRGVANSPFLSALIEPSLASSSDFLGYENPRPTAPFAYANAWGNNLALLLPFFLFSWTGRDAGWRRIAAPFVLAVAAFGVVYSLNRGVWLGLSVAGLYLSVRLAMAGRATALISLLGGLLVVGVLIVATPLGDTIALRLETPHSNDRREAVAETVVRTTWEGSPLLGYGSTRQVEGSFFSIAGGSSPDCHQCAAPPLGTQGFLWRLIFTTGFVGTAFFVSFMAVQLIRHARAPGPYALIGTTLILMSAVFILVYDSLESPLFMLMIGIGLMNRERLAVDDA